LGTFEELYGLPCCACDIGNAFLPGKNLIINKSLYGLKTSAVRFHEHLAESLLRLGFTKTRRDNDLWIVDKTSHYKHFST
jgi:hypothetical protein